MRVTQNLITQNAIRHISENLERVTETRQKTASGKLFQRVSEDPVRASRSLSLRSNLRVLQSYADTAQSAENWLTANENALAQLDDIGIRANDLILQGLNDTLSGAERANALGAEMQNLLSQAASLGNETLNGLSLFAGSQVHSPAFFLQDAASPLLDYAGNPFTPQEISYLGDSFTMPRNISPDQTLTINLRGDQVMGEFLQSLNLASNALRQNHIHNTGDPLTDPLTLQSALTRLKSATETLNAHRTINGARLRQTENAANFLETIQIESKSLLSQNEDVNLAESVALLANQETTYQAALEVSQRAISALSLFDYLRS